MTNSNEDKEEEDDDDEKEVIIADLRQQLKKVQNDLDVANTTINILNEEIFREKTINNKLMGIPPPFTSTEHNTPDPLQSSLQSPLLTPAQRTSRSDVINSPITPTLCVGDSLPSQFDCLQLTGQSGEKTSSDSEEHSVNSSPDQSVSNQLLERSQPTGQNGDKPASDSQKQSVNNPLDQCVDSHSSNPKPLAPLHISDIKRSKRLSYILNTFKNLSPFRTTVLIGDSNMHGINDGELDKANRSVCVRSFSGLCVVSAAYAFKRHKDTHDKVRRVIFSLGTNDYLHLQQHCEDDWKVHLSNLLREARRVFPNASLGFIKPFTGLPSVPNEFIRFLDECLKEVDPQVKRYNSPSMNMKVKPDGVHLNDEGVKAFRDYLVYTFLGARSRPRSDQPPVRYPRQPSVVDNDPVFNPSSQNTFPNGDYDRRQHMNSPPNQHNEPVRDPNFYSTFSDRSSFPSHPPLAVPPLGAVPQCYMQYPQPNSHAQVLRDITEALAAMMYSHRRNAAVNQFSS